jgi:hypothetical protein
MQMYEIMFYAGMVCFVLGCIVTIILFVKNDIAKTIGDVTGHNAKKAMKKMQQDREEKEQEREDKSQAVSEEKKGKRSFIGKMRDEKTAVLLNQDNKTDVLAKTEAGAVSDSESQTDVLPQSPKRSGELLQNFSHVFQVEEEMTVLGGEIVDTLPTTILSEEISFSSGLDIDVETGVLTEETTSVLRDEATDVLAAEEATDVLAAEEAADKK